MTRVITLFSVRLVLLTLIPALCFADEVVTLCIAAKSSGGRHIRSAYITTSGQCRQAYQPVVIERQDVEQIVEERLNRPIVGVPYEYHLNLPFVNATGWAILHSNNTWSTRIRLSWEDESGRHEQGSEDMEYRFVTREGRAARVAGGNAFAWFSPPTAENPFPIFQAAWSNKVERNCSTLDIHDEANTLEYFNVEGYSPLRGGCPVGFEPPYELQHPHFSASFEF